MESQKKVVISANKMSGEVNVEDALYSLSKNEEGKLK